MPEEPSSFDSNPRQHWALAILGLLRERPMHPYEMRRVMALRHKDERLELRPGSLYNAADWLVERGLIEVSGSGRQGRRPKRTIYRITPSGEATLNSWVAEMIALPRRDTSSFSVALDHLVHVSPEAAAEALRRRQAALTSLIAQMETTVKTLRPRIGRINLIEVEHDLALARAEVRWIGSTLLALRQGSLEWNTQEVLAAARAAASPEPVAVSSPAKKVARRRRSPREAASKA